MTEYAALRLSLEGARDALRAGRLLLFPTETVYGLGCDAMNPDAVAAVYAVKKRALSMPLPVIIASEEHLFRLVYRPSRAARALMDIFWPGPLSLVLPARREVPDLLIGGTRRVAVRFSPHPGAQALCLEFGGPLVATSANISGGPSVSSPSALNPELCRQTAGLLDMGPLPEGGKASTLVELSENGSSVSVRILRDGAITAAALREAGFAVIETRRHKRPALQ